MTQVAERFAEAAGKYLTGSEPFTAKLHPAHAPYADYDQLMRLEEWYGRESGTVVSPADRPPASAS